MLYKVTGACYSVCLCLCVCVCVCVCVLCAGGGVRVQWCVV